MGELTRFTDEDDSPSKEDDKGKPTPRWVRPPLVPESLDLHKPPLETSPPPKVSLLEQVLGHEMVEEDDDDEDDDDEEKDGKTPLADQTEADEKPGKEASSETGLGSSANTGFEEIMKDMGPEYEAATSGDELDELNTLQISHEDLMSQTAESVSEDAEEEDEPTSMSTAGSGGFTPPPPTGPFGSAAAAGSPNQGPASNRYAHSLNMAPQLNTLQNFNISPPQSVITPEQVRDTERNAEKRGLRRGLVAGFITGYVVKAYLANRKHERYEKAVQKQIEQRDEQISGMRREQQSRDFRREQEESARIKAESFEKPVPKPAAEVLATQNQNQEEIFDQEGNRIILQPGWRVERSAGGYSVVLDEHNRVVHDAITYGEAFIRDQKREQLSDDVFAAVDSAAAGVAQHSAGTIYAPVSQANTGQANAGQTPYGGQNQPVDLNHRLPKPRNQVINTVASPWLWTAIAILIIVYFVAALA